MTAICEDDIVAKWTALKWHSGRYAAFDRKSVPLEVSAAQKKAGIYRMTWDGTEDWHLFPKEIKVHASRKVEAPALKLATVEPPVLLTIGCSLNVHGRLKQHFSTNEKGNRMLKAMRKLFPGRSDEVVLGLARRNLLIEWVYVENWLDRCLLEHYGCALGIPLCDLRAEY